MIFLFEISLFAQREPIVLLHTTYDVVINLRVAVNVNPWALPEILIGSLGLRLTYRVTSDGDAARLI